MSAKSSSRDIIYKSTALSVYELNQNQVRNLISSSLKGGKIYTCCWQKTLSQQHVYIQPEPQKTNLLLQNMEDNLFREKNLLSQKKKTDENLVNQIKRRSHGECTASNSGIMSINTSVFRLRRRSISVQNTLHGTVLALTQTMMQMHIYSTVNVNVTESCATWSARPHMHTEDKAQTGFEAQKEYPIHSIPPHPYVIKCHFAINSALTPACKNRHAERYRHRDKHICQPTPA